MDGSYLRDGLDKANAIVGSFDFGQTVTKVVPVIFPCAQKRGLLILAKLFETTKALLKQSLDKFLFFLPSFIHNQEG